VPPELFSSIKACGAMDWIEPDNILSYRDFSPEYISLYQLGDLIRLEHISIT
jgi:hypothetical protein